MECDIDYYIKADDSSAPHQLFFYDIMDMMQGRGTLKPNSLTMGCDCPPRGALDGGFGCSK